MVEKVKLKENESKKLRAFLSNDSMIESEGSLFYSEGIRMFNNLKLKKEILVPLGIKKGSRSKIRYKAELYRSHEDFMKKIAKIVENNLPLPIMLYLYEVIDDGDD